jgi:hypothetical protein
MRTAFRKIIKYVPRPIQSDRILRRAFLTKSSVPPRDPALSESTVHLKLFLGTAHVILLLIVSGTRKWNLRKSVSATPSVPSKIEALFFWGPRQMLRRLHDGLRHMRSCPLVSISIRVGRIFSDSRCPAATLAAGFHAEDNYCCWPLASPRSRQALLELSGP